MAPPPVFGQVLAAPTGRAGGTRPPSGSPKGLIPVVGTVWVQLVVWVTGSHGASVAPPTTPMYPGTSVVPSTNRSCQVEPLESRAWALPDAQFEFTITAP